VPPPGAPANGWRWIVIHHSDDVSGNLAKYDRIHREVNRWDECGYHFVIGNGTLSGDGQVEVGSRWPKQKHGAHAKTDDNRFNDYGIGICLVGDFERGGRPTPAQMENLVSLCRWLMARYGIPASAVIGHCDCKPTACPGRNFPWAELRAALQR
jgi:N-acetyl-anhydromuramyl-L-alanine amidase AmpD